MGDSRVSYSPVDGVDSSLFNNELDGKFLYTHLKYYNGTVDLVSLLPQEERDLFKKQLNDHVERVKNMSHDQIIDDLVSQKHITDKRGKAIKNHVKNLSDYIASVSTPNKDNLLKWCVDRENETRSDKTLSFDEKKSILHHQTLLRYALKWKLEQMPSIVKGARASQVNDFWSTLACYVGTISAYTGIATAYSAGNVILGASIGAALGVVNGIIICSGGGNPNTCQDPVTVSFPYECYTYGNPLLCKAVGYGNTTPSQFTFRFSNNDNLNNQLWSNFTDQNYIWLPGSYLNSSITDVAVQCQTSCSSGNPLWFGWFQLSDLGKPYFTISGNSNFNVSDIANAGNSFPYQIVGPVSNTNATIQWELIPSGYPNYSATGTIIYGANSWQLGVRWDNHAGFARLKCTATVGCSTITNYYTVHIN